MNKLYCLIGPSSAGKDTIKFASGYPYVVSYRTRPIREGEQEGIDGYFITREKFYELEEKYGFVAKTDYAGNLYAVTKEELKRLEEGPLVYVIDWDGYLYMKDKLPKIFPNTKAVSIYIDVKKETLIERIKENRKGIIEQRLKQMEKDLLVKDKCDYIIDNNGTIEAAVKQLHDIIKKESALKN